MIQSIWELVGEQFTQELARMTAVYVKETDESISFAYPTGDSRSSFYFDFSEKTGYDLPAKFRMDFAVYEYPSIMGTLGANRALFREQTYFPSLIRRSFEYTNIGIMGVERFGRRVDGAFTWAFDLHCRNEWHPFHKKLYSVLSSEEAFTVERERDTLTVSFEDMRYHIAVGGSFQIGLYAEERLMKADLRRQQLSVLDGPGYSLVIEHAFHLEPGEDAQFSFGLSAESAQKAREGLAAEAFEERLRGAWDAWFESLPTVGHMSEEEAKVYYKCWWTIKNNYYHHPQWGFCITEALPVYKGVWQWAIPSVEWHSEQNTDHTSEWIRKSMDMLLDSQRNDGYVTHAIYIDEKVPGERWAAGNSVGIVQTPHLPWVAMRYYHTTLDLPSLRRWYAPLARYYDYLCESRDTGFFNWHLWAITTSFDTGLDTTSAFQRVTYGEPGIPKERFCYPAIFGAERYRFEQAMAEIAALIGEDSSGWTAEAEKTKAAMQAHLWDADRRWYGVVHEDGSLDTRVGVDGLFALVYGMVGRKQAALMEKNMERLIGPYGVRTVAEGEPGFREDVYWRGASWPKSCSLGMAACCRYYPHLAERVYSSVLRMCLAHPSIWECYNVRTGELAHSDHGFFCTPGVSSNVGAGDILGTLWLYHGLAMYEMDMALPAVPMHSFHWSGLRINVSEKHNSFTVSACPAEAESGAVRFRTADGICTAELGAGETSLQI